MVTPNPASPSGACETGRGQRCAMPWQMMLIDLTGEVVPCAYLHDSDKEQRFGNANTNTLADIWNGPGYRDLRARHASGDLDGHGCGSCVAKRMQGIFPGFETADGLRHEGGRCFITQIPDRFWREHAHAADEIELLEDGVPLPHARVEHEQIRRRGGGRYSVWRGDVYLSASDDTHPAYNGRRYSLRHGGAEVELTRLHLNTPAADNLLQSLAEFEQGAVEMRARPSLITFIETSDCNIDCPACSQNEVRLNNIRHRDGTRAEVLALVPYLQQLIWHGGEPFMMRGFRDFLESYTAELNPNLAFGFMSNGTMITAPRVDQLDKFERFNVTISMDSFVPETYERWRAGAKFDRVRANLDGLRALEDWPKRKVTVAMIVGKTNFQDLPYNLRFALDREIRLMINPINFYPVTERLGVFSDFAAQTASWEGVLEACAEIGREADASGALALRGLDYHGALAELRRIYEREKMAHQDLVSLEVEIEDPSGALAGMRRPGLLLQGDLGPYSAVAYLETRAAGRHVLQAPRSRIPSPARLVFYTDLVESGSEHHFTEPLDLACQTAPVTFLVPPYVAPPRPRNIHYVRRQGSGVQMTEIPDLHRAYVAMRERESLLGFGLRPMQPEVTAEAAAEENAQATLGWAPPIIDFQRPYLGSGHPRGAE